MAEKRARGTPFKVGHPGGPGRPPLSPEVKEFRQMTAESLCESLKRYLDEPDEFIESIDLKKVSFHDAIMLKTLKNLRNKGDISKTDVLWTRMVGKPKETHSVTMSHDADPEVFEKMLSLLQNKSGDD